MFPSITIITVCKNAVETIERTLQSVLMQSHPVDQYVIIDGGSTDGTLNIIQSYQEAFGGRLEWVSEPDQGIYDAMNKGLERSTGNIAGILNADDWYEVDAIKHVIATASTNPPGVYYGMLRKWFEGKECEIVRKGHEFLWQQMIPHPASFVHAEVYKTYGLFDSTFQLAGDYELMMRVASHDVPFYPVDSILANFVIGGASRKKSRALWLETIKIRRRYNTLSLGQYWIFRALIEARSFVERFLLKERISL
jgi:glycosyltransferase involved in cell wall biosynthesis